MTDIVERLRVQYREGLMFVPDGHVNVSFGDAADEIERLRKALQAIADNEIAEYPDVDMIRDFAYAALEVNK
jgi:hypothetical protein